MTSGPPSLMSDATDRYLDHTVETLPRERLRALQLRRLLDMVGFAYERSGLVRSTWDAVGVAPAGVQSVEDFTAAVPFTSKAASLAFRERTGDPFGGICCVDPGSLVLAGVSSGTSGSIVFFPERWAEPALEPRPVPAPSALISTAQQATWDRNLWEMGLRPGDYMMYSTYTFRGPNFHPCLAIGGIPVLTDHYPYDFARMVRLAAELRPTVLYLLSGPMMVELEKLTDVDRRDAFSSFRGIAWGGESLSPHNRALLDDWGIRPLQVANVGDAAGAIECQERTGAHVWEDTVFMEVLDPDDGTEVADGAIGELVVTSLTNMVSPLVRWRSDDLVRVDRRPCGCGRTHARIAIVGRRGDHVVVDGRSVVPADIVPILEAIPATNTALFQVIRTTSHIDRLRVRVGHRDDMPVALDSLRVDITDAIEAALGVSCDVELVEQSRLLEQGPPHKIPRVVRR
jgi:phenylacetate-CoA ligase